MTDPRPDPDFEQIARPLIEKLSDTMGPENARGLVIEQLSQIFEAGWWAALISERHSPEMSIDQEKYIEVGEAWDRFVAGRHEPGQ